MSERHNQKLIIPVTHLPAFGDIGDRALETVEQRYGSSYPRFTHGEHGTLAYHGTWHSMDAAQSTMRGGIKLGMRMAALQVGVSAMKAHDIVQMKERGVMERESAEWYEEQVRSLPNFPQVDLAAKMGGLVILGTEPVIEGGRIVGQMAERLDYPTKEARELGLLGACGDLAGIHSSVGPYMAHMLYKEIRGMNPEDTPQDMNDVLKFQRGQAGFTASYRYPHPRGDEIFGGLRGAIVSHHESLVGELESGRIENWGDIISADLQFLARHAGADES